MKKLFIIVLVICTTFIFAGCSFAKTETLNCSKSSGSASDQGISTATVKIKFKDKKFDKASLKVTYEIDENLVDEDTMSGTKSLCKRLGEKIPFSDCDVKTEKNKLELNANLIKTENNKTLESAKEEFEKEGYTCSTK